VCNHSIWELVVLGDAHKQSDRDLNRFGTAFKAASFITELHLENNLSAAAPIRAGQGAARTAASTRAAKDAQEQ
jgi:hypothetical protein